MAKDLLFDRRAILTIDTLQITDLDFTFTVKKDLKGKPNTADIKVWNLSEPHRNALEQMAAATVQLEAGYAGGTSVIFLGDLMTSSPSQYEGADIVSVVSSADGGKKHRSARIHVAHRKGATTRTILQSLVTALGVMPGNSAKSIAAIQASGVGDLFTLGTVLSGSAAQEMTRICRAVGWTWSIQNGALQMLQIGASLAGTAISVNQSTGMIGSPSIDKDGFLTCKSLIVPDVFPGRLMVLTSQRISGQFKIVETTHTGDRKGQSWYVEIKAKRY